MAVRLRFEIRYLTPPRQRAQDRRADRAKQAETISWLTRPKPPEEGEQGVSMGEWTVLPLASVIE